MKPTFAVTIKANDPRDSRRFFLHFENGQLSTLGNRDLIREVRDLLNRTWPEEEEPPLTETDPNQSNSLTDA